MGKNAFGRENLLHKLRVRAFIYRVLIFERLQYDHGYETDTCSNASTNATNVRSCCFDRHRVYFYRLRKYWYLRKSRSNRSIAAAIAAAIAATFAATSAFTSAEESVR